MKTLLKIVLVVVIIGAVMMLAPSPLFLIGLVGLDYLDKHI